MGVTPAKPSTRPLEPFAALRAAGIVLAFAIAAGLMPATPSRGEPAPAPPASPEAAKAPAYAVVQGQHPESANPWQSLTIICPDGLKVFGAGFSAVVRDVAAPGAKAPAYHEEGLNNVRSVPDINGAGWRIEGVSPGAAASKQPWRLSGRLVCVRVAA